MPISFVSVHPPRFAAARDIIPPAGRSLVRTANNKRPRASITSGVASKIEVSSEELASNHLSCFSALRIPQGRAINHAMRVEEPASNKVLRARDQSKGATGALYANENPSSPCATDLTQWI